MTPFRRRKNERLRAALSPCTGLLCGQGDGVLAQYPFGLSSVAFSGCEAIAIHNLLVLCGQGIPFSRVLSAVEGDCWLWGWFGIFPRRIGRCLARLGVNSHPTREISALCRAITTGTPVIFSFWTGRPFCSSIHTVCAVRRGDDCVIYNRYNHCTEPWRLRMRGVFYFQNI